VDDCKNLSDHEALIRRIAQQRRTSSWNLQKRSCFIVKDDLLLRVTAKGRKS
jgi:hypothetical protein